MMINSDLMSAVATERRRSLERAAVRYRLAELARPARPARSAWLARLTRPARPAADSGPAPSPAPAALPRPVTERATTVAGRPADSNCAA